jgi:hypothetical protein
MTPSSRTPSPIDDAEWRLWPVRRKCQVVLRCGINWTDHGPRRIYVNASVQVCYICLTRLAPSLDTDKEAIRRGTRMNRHRIAAFTVAAIVGLGGATALGQGSGREQTPSQQAATLADALRVGGIDSPARGLASFVRIVGFVWTEGDHPVLYPRLVIRDLTNGQVVDETTGSEAGEFRFEGLSAGAYVIELLGDPASSYLIGTAPASGGGGRFAGTT